MHTNVDNADFEPIDFIHVFDAPVLETGVFGVAVCCKGWDENYLLQINETISQ